jgi:hypothetical protein
MVARNTSRLGLLGPSLLCAAVLGCTGANTSPDAGPATRPDGGSAIACLDNDGDGVPGTGNCADLAVVDCDDADPNRSPLATEVCDGVDNDCDGLIDEGLPQFEHYLDADGDGYGAGEPLLSCRQQEPGRVQKAGDCDDTNSAVFPGAPEACNGKDDNCNGQIDDDVVTRDFYTDADGDGYGAGAPTPSCQASLPGKSPIGGDCNDADPKVNPAATEVCNGKDDNCNGQVDETFPSKGDGCATGQGGVCAAGVYQCVSGTQTCVRLNEPQPETCDGIDNDCDGAVDQTFPNKGQSCTAGIGVCARSGTFVCRADGSGTQCNATAGSPTPAACDGLDNDCDGLTDEPELVEYFGLAAAQPTDVAVAPFFFTASSCNGGRAGSGTDAWSAYYLAVVRDTELYVQQVEEDGYPASALTHISSFGGYAEVAIAQAGGGLAVAGRYGQSYIDLYFIAPGPTAQTLAGSSYYLAVQAPSGTALSNVRLVRGNGGRVVLLWRETTSAGSKIRMARYSFASAGSGDWTPTVHTAARDLITSSGSNGAFGAASNHIEYGDVVGCPTGSARFAVAHRLGEVLLTHVFDEDGVTTGSAFTVYSGSASASPREPSVAYGWANADRWAVAHTVVDSGFNDAALHYWHSGQAGGSARYGPYFNANGTASVEQPRVVSRAGEFLVSALAYGSGGLSTQPQAWMGKRGLDGSVVVPVGQVTHHACSTPPGCVGGTRSVVRPLASSSGLFKSQGAVVFAGSGSFDAAVLGCN